MPREAIVHAGGIAASPTAADAPLRLLIINPNRSGSMTQHLRSEAQREFAQAAVVDVVTAANGPQYVETQADEDIAAAAVLDIVRRLERRKLPGAGEGGAASAVAHGLPVVPVDYDAYAVGCFSDPALSLAREATPKPVIGFGEATLLFAHGLGVDFALICNVDSDVLSLREMAARYGLDTRLAGIRPTGFSIAAFDRGDPRAFEALRAVAREAVDSGNVGALCLGCAVFVGCRQALADELGVPVFEGMRSAVELASFYARMRTAVNPQQEMHTM